MFTRLPTSGFPVTLTRNTLRNLRSLLRLAEHIRDACEAGACASNNSGSLFDGHILFHGGRSLLRRAALDFTLLVNADALDAAEQVEHNRALHALVAAVCAAQFCETPVDTVVVAHSWQAQNDGSRDLVIEVDDTCDETGEFLLAIDEIRFMKGCYGRFEYIVAEVVANRRLFFEAREERSKDADDCYDRTSVTDANR